MQMVFRNKRLLGDDIYSFEFEPERSVDYIAGQFAEFVIKHDKPDAKGMRRWFTISSSPHELCVAITIRCRQPLSSYKQALLNLQHGDTVLADEPIGDFVLPLDESRPLLWIAGGIGITPFRSMASWMAASNEQRDVHLLHSVSNSNQLLFNDTFSAAGIDEIEVVNSTDVNRLTIETILQKIPDARERLIYISGPESMVIGLTQGLKAAGFERDDIIVDQFLGYS